MKNYIYLLPHVFAMQNETKAIFYNTTNYKTLIKDNSLLKDFFAKLFDFNNYRVVELSKADMQNVDILSLIEDLHKYSIGGIYSSESDTLPVQSVPLMRVRRNIDTLKELDNTGFARGNLLFYINELTIILNNRCTANCEYCSYAYRQIASCTKSVNIDQYIEINIDDVKKLLVCYKQFNIDKINICGGNIFLYNNLPSLLDYLKELSIVTELFLHSANITNDIDFFKKLLNDSNCILNISTDTKHVNMANLVNIVSLIDKSKYKIHFIIEKESEVDLALQFIKNNSLENYSFKPLINQNNYEFFSENVFLDKESILSQSLTYKDIFANREINKQFFGRLFLLPGGDIKSNLSLPAIGNIKRDNLNDLIYTELYNENCWLLTRQKISPCNKCIYQALCPPISNYELYLNRFNLCSVHADA